jgi:hypothetical protein
MITVTISGPPKSGKSMLVNLLAVVLVDMVGVEVNVEDDDKQGHPRVFTTTGVGTLMRKIFSSERITIRTAQTRRE